MHILLLARAKRIPNYFIKTKLCDLVLVWSSLKINNKYK